jgi:PKHD-type hydroxylase
MIYTEPKWKSYAVITNDPIFTSEQCNDIIRAGRQEPRKIGEVQRKDGSDNLDASKRTSHISWIPFKKMIPMYKRLEKIMLSTNVNHFGFDGMTITEMAQYTEYPEGGFYDWHVDNDVNFPHEPPVRKISMTCLLSSPTEFEGGDLEIMNEKDIIKLKQGQAVFFASFLKHRVTPVKKGNRKSLVMWFGGPPLR